MNSALVRLCTACMTLTDQNGKVETEYGLLLSDIQVELIMSNQSLSRDD